MDEDINDLLESRHRKEKRELQAQIQALKKAAKNDKTKKKELSAVIARLETEIEDRHNDELQAAASGVNPDSELQMDEEHPEDTVKTKISKAQKRRDKKSQQEKQRAEEIKLQEQENINGPRNLEMQAISSKLKNHGLQIYSIPSDGDCLYKAVAHQLEVLRRKTISANDLRGNVANFISSNKDDFLPFMSNPDTCDMLTEEEFQDYCEKIASTKVWGGQLEIRALSSCLKCPINVIQATGPEWIEQGAEYEGPPLIIAYHRHMYKLGEHYNSTQPVIVDDT